MYLKPTVDLCLGKYALACLHMTLTTHQAEPSIKLSYLPLDIAESLNAASGVAYVCLHTQPVALLKGSMNSNDRDRAL